MAELRSNAPKGTSPRTELRQIWRRRRSRSGIVTLALVSHFWPLPEPAKSLEMLQRHEAKRSEFGGALCQRDNADGAVSGGVAGTEASLRLSTFS